MTAGIPLGDAEIVVERDGFDVVVEGAEFADELIVIGVGGPEGPPGAGGVLTPEQIAQLTDDVTADVLEEIEPDINLVIRFRNIRSQG